jgi:hypothetical protein
MVTSVQLSKVVAEALGLSVSTVRLHLRNLSEAGEITFKGYGSSAAAMTPLDAANLVIAAAGSTFVKDSNATLRAFGDLTRTLGPESDAPTFSQTLAYFLQDLSEPGEMPTGSTDAGRRTAVKMITTVGRGNDGPCAALLNAGALEMGFALGEWRHRRIDETEFAAFQPDGVLIQCRHIPFGALRRIALSLPE